MKIGFGTRYIIPTAALSSPRAFTADAFSGTHSLFGSAGRGKSILSVKEPGFLAGEGSAQPLTTAILPPAGSSWPRAQAGSPPAFEGLLVLMALLCLSASSLPFPRPVFAVTAGTSTQSKVMIDVIRIFWEERLPPPLSVSRGGVPFQGHRWLKGKEWQLCAGLMSEPTYLKVKCY